MMEQEIKVNFPGRGRLRQRFLSSLSDPINVLEGILRSRQPKMSAFPRPLLDQSCQALGEARRQTKDAKEIWLSPEQAAQFYWLGDGDIEDERFFFEEARLPFDKTWFSFGRGFPIMALSYPKDIVEGNLRALLVTTDDWEESPFIDLMAITDFLTVEATIFPLKYPFFPHERCPSSSLTKDGKFFDFDKSNCPPELRPSDPKKPCLFPYGHLDRFAEGCPGSRVVGAIMRFAVLLLAFINARNVKLEYVDPFAEKRGLARGGGKEWPDPWYEVHINTSGLRTTSESAGTGLKHGHIYDVRGHFRRLTHECYYRDEDGYVKVIWVPAHLRGLSSGGPYIPSIRRVINNRKKATYA